MIDWQPIETAPKGGDETVLLFIPDGYYNHSDGTYSHDVALGFCSSSGRWMATDAQCGGSYPCEPTFWCLITHPITGQPI
jgi:hypothetical protein